VKLGNFEIRVSEVIAVQYYSLKNAYPMHAYVYFKRRDDPLQVSEISEAERAAFDACLSQEKAQP
jgi:hypothetical protein